MTRFSLETYALPAAPLGPENPFPMLHAPMGFSDYVNALVVDDAVPPRGREHMKYGLVAGCMPYQLQDGYSRVREVQDMPAVVMENDHLRATFLIGLGGRLWSLRHKATQTELLYCNPVFQPANLAMRSAWFSGGVEWNFGVPGHTPLTCAPMHCARVAGPDGAPVLRMYEYERIRGMVYQLDFHLPDDSEFLLVHVRLINSHSCAKPTYWWSNIAVPQRPDIRVVAPARQAFHAGRRPFYMEMVDVPYDATLGFDNTYATNAPFAGEYFYDVPDGQRPWVTALDRDGVGLIQASTMRLHGRKLFDWGVEQGSWRWQEWLSEPGQAYIEIQAGLAPTQTQCLPMPAETEWEWLEAYGRCQADAAVVHGADWDRAVAEVQTGLDKRLPMAFLNEKMQATAVTARQAPEEMLQHGSGWGWLEQRRRQLDGERPLADAALVFSEESLTAVEQPWRALLETGTMPEMDPINFSGGYLLEPSWRDMLTRSVEQGASDHWLGWMQTGVMAYIAGDKDCAGHCWRQSIARKNNAFAQRNLALLARERDQYDTALEHMAAAWSVGPSQPLAIEYTQYLVAAELWDRLEAFIAELPPEYADHGRIQFAQAQAALVQGKLDRVAEILETAEVVDMRECETTLTDIWFRMHEQRLAAQRQQDIDEALQREVRQLFPPPARIDFRMNTME